MATYRTACMDCQQTIDVYVGQSVYDRKLVWHQSYRCPNCGMAIEEDDIGSPPDELRQLILEQEGSWCLQIAEIGDSAIIAAKILRKLMNLSLPDIANVKKKIPGEVTIGTQVEMEWLVKNLRAEGIQAFILPKKR